MSCINGFPIDITNNPKGTCDLKCKFSFKYNDSTSTITNIGKKYLKLSYEKINTYPVVFNSYPYYVSDVLIFSPSLHTYSGLRADAELIIKHSSDYNTRLWVCIPLVKSNSVNKYTQTLDNIINASKFANKSGSSTYMKETINLNDFIPNKKFYTYKNCANSENFIVFSKDDGAFATIKESQLTDLKKNIGDYTSFIKTNQTNEFYVNNKGPEGLSGDITGDIYIDCKPVSDDGKIIEDTPPKMSSLEEMFSPESMKKFKDSNAFKILIAFLSLIGIFILYKIIMKIIDKFFGAEEGGDTGKPKPIVNDSGTPVSSSASSSASADVETGEKSSS